MGKVLSLSRCNCFQTNKLLVKRLFVFLIVIIRLCTTLWYIFKTYLYYLLRNSTTKPCPMNFDVPHCVSGASFVFVFVSVFDSLVSIE